MHCSAKMLEQRPNLLVLRARSDTGCHVQPPVFAYPFWTAMLDSKAALSLEPNSFNLLQAFVPAGDNVVTFRFAPRTQLRNWSGSVSLLTLLLAVSWYWLGSMGGASSRR